MQATVFPTPEEVLYLHRRLIERFGGARGVRDLGLVESALYRPRTGYYDTLAEQAAALLQSFALNHGFVDGNKRIAFALCAIFLRLNGYRLIAHPDEAERFLIERVIAGRAPLAEIAQWIEQTLEAVAEAESDS